MLGGGRGAVQDTGVSTQFEVLTDNREVPCALRAIRFDFTVKADFSITTSRSPCAGIAVRVRSS